MKWGMQAFDTFKVVPPGIGIVHQVNLEYLARGVHTQADGRLLPRHAGRHRLAHDHDQRHRRRRLGRGRHRGRSRHARPAGVLPHARRGRRPPDRQAARRRDRDRPRADRHRDAAQGEGRRQVRRVLRRRHRRRCRCPTARPSPTWRPSTARPWASSRSTTRPIDYLKGTGRTRRRRSRRSRPTSRRRTCSAFPKAGDIDYTPGRLSSTSATVAPVAGRPEASAGPHRARPRRSRASTRCSRSRRRKRLRQEGRPSSTEQYTDAADGVERARTATC